MQGAWHGSTNPNSYDTQVKVPPNTMKVTPLASSATEKDYVVLVCLFHFTQLGQLKKR